MLTFNVPVCQETQSGPTQPPFAAAFSASISSANRSEFLTRFNASVSTVSFLRLVTCNDSNYSSIYPKKTSIVLRGALLQTLKAYLFFSVFENLHSRFQYNIELLHNIE